MGAAAPRFDSITVIVCDSVGCGLAPDAAAYGDEGANTLAHVISAGRPSLPNLERLGLGRIPGLSGLVAAPPQPQAAWGRMVETAPGKDTMLGHWELMGVVAKHNFPMYPDGFPEEVLGPFRTRTGRDIIGNKAASGTVILDELGAEHMATGKLIVYTSGDSVFQVAAHEEVVAIEELYAICAIAREQLRDEHGVGRVIARPFVGTGPGSFRRTPRRKDLPLPPPQRTALDHLVTSGVGTYAIGKINDIFAGRGIIGYEKTDNNAAGIEATRQAMLARRQPFIFTNLVDFDSEYGHRNDPVGYAAALEEFDRSIPSLEAAVPQNGCLIITADHGNDPTTPGTDHSRECVPLLVAGRGTVCADLGTRATFADLAATILDNFGVDTALPGTSFRSRL